MATETVTTQDLLLRGLKIVYTDDEINRFRKESTKSDTFILHFGARPEALAAQWNDLVTTTIPEAVLNEGCKNPTKFLFAHFYMKEYPKDRRLKSIFHLYRAECREWIWYFIYKIAMLKEFKIMLPEYWKTAKDMALFTVDGVHFWTKEFSLADIPFDSKRYSQKNNHAGLAYEVALALSESLIIWTSGPFKAGTGDITIYKKKGGLMEKVPESCLGIADNGYNARNIAKPNSLDDPDVKDFKSRARSRQEAINSRIKAYQCFAQRFRHNEEKHELLFTAACVTLNYDMKDGGRPLFDI